MNTPASTLREQRQTMLQAGLDLIDQGFTVFDADLRLVAWNRAFLRLLDFPAHLAYEGVSFENFIRYNAQRGEYGGNDAEAHIAQRVMAARNFTPHDIERVRPDGRLLRIVGQPLSGHGFVTLYSDITEQRRAEREIGQTNALLENRVAERTAELRRSEQQIRLITDSIPVLVGYVDHSRTYRYVNRGYRDWFGLDPAHPGAISARAFLGNTTFDAIKPFVARAFAGESVSFEYTLARIDGTHIRVRTSLIPDRGVNGEVAGCFELTFDNTEHLRAQELVIRAQKMEALGALTGGLAHDFNNLLTVVIGNLARLAAQRSDDPATQQLVEPALKAAQHGAELIRRLLRFARRQPLQAVAVDAVQALANVVEMARGSLPHTLQIELTSATQPLWAWVDPSELEAALLNLLINARDATAGSGRVSLLAASDVLPANTTGTPAVTPGRCVRIDVTDTGCGMDAATLSHLFEPFFTTKPPGAGTGLGLAMVYGFVHQSGGAIDVRSQPGQGSTFSIWLPATEAPGAAAATPPANARGAAQQGLALLVEDDAAVRQVVRRSLLDLGYAVLEAENGVEALAILASTPGIVLLLTDVVMPGGVDGRDLARQARDDHGIARVLLMSGHAPVRAEPGSLPLLRKPFSPAQLATALQGLAR